MRTRRCEIQSIGTEHERLSRRLVVLSLRVSTRTHSSSKREQSAACCSLRAENAVARLYSALCTKHNTRRLESTTKRRRLAQRAGRRRSIEWRDDAIAHRRGRSGRRCLFLRAVHLLLRQSHLFLHRQRFRLLLARAFAARLQRFLQAEEHRTELGQPVTIDARHALHVFLNGSSQTRPIGQSSDAYLRRHDQFMIDDIIRGETTTEQRAGRMQMARHAGT